MDKTHTPPLPRDALRAMTYADETALVRDLAARVPLDADARRAVVRDAAKLVAEVRRRSSPTVMEAFLAEYGLSTDEGVGLMCLAEALLRVPDAETIDELIADKIEPSNWGAHLGHSTSSLVNAATWGLLLTGRVLDDDPARPAKALRSMVRRLGEPVVRRAVGQAMKLMGRSFVLGETIGSAMDRAEGMEAKGYTYSYDMLGEAARTDADARRYAKAYSDAIKAIAKAAKGDVRSSPGISVKLSALHPRYEWTHRAEVMEVLVPRALELARAAARAGIGFNIDAEEADRLDLSLDVIEAMLPDPELAGWDGFGVVIQAYGRRAGPAIDWLYALAERHDRRIMVRLVKGAYWDAEIKIAQERGLPGFPVFTRKDSTDVSYIANAGKLLAMRDRIYPQFATHNAHTVAAVLAMAGDTESFEFQRLHGMGEALHAIIHETKGTRCRIYAPVGAHRDLLAYLVRRLLENGANSSFVNQIVDKSLAPETIAADPVAEIEALDVIPNPGIRRPAELFKGRANAKGWNVNEPASVLPLIAAREEWRTHVWGAEGVPVTNPADPDDVVGHVVEATGEDVAAALVSAREGFAAWSATPAAERAAALRRTADLYEENAAELTAIATREAGKTLLDAVAEVREAVDFLRYYADAAEAATGAPRGVMVCISPWNFPLAIFTGQVAACLGAGNAVLAKPAEQTPLIARRAVEMMRAAGVPTEALQLLPGDGPTVGGPLTASPDIAGVCFTGSTEVARIINRTLAANAAPDAVLIAETGGLNAMIVDSTALTEQVVRDVLASAFQSAGQRCSALRVLYVQEEARKRVLEMLTGAMDTLHVGDPWDTDTDVGPVIDAEAEDGIKAYLDAQGAKVIKKMDVPSRGRFVPPAIVAVDGIGAVEREIFGPVLHVASFRASQLDKRRGRHQRARLRPDLRASQPDRRPGRARDRAASCRQRLRQPQPDRRHRRQPAFRRRGAVRDRSQGGRAALPAPASEAGADGGSGGSRRAGDRRRRAREGVRRARRAGMGRADRPRGDPARGARGGPSGAGRGRRSAGGAGGPARTDRREQPARPARPRPRALSRRRCGDGAGAGAPVARRRQSDRRGGARREGGSVVSDRRAPAARGPRRDAGGRRPDRPARPRNRRSARTGRLAARASEGAGRARRADRAAGDRGARGGAVVARTASLHRHDGGGRKREPARLERLTGRPRTGF